MKLSREQSKRSKKALNNKISKSIKTKIFIIIFVFILALFGKTNQSEENVVEQVSAPSGFYVVKKVTDGDTITVEINGTDEKVRLIGLNTPETVDPRRDVQCFGKEASQKMKDIAEGKYVRLESDSTQDDRDKYERLLRYVYLEDGKNLNKLMIEEGYGYEYTYKVPYMFQQEFKKAEIEAKEAQRGLWSENACDGF